MVVQVITAAFAKSAETTMKKAFLTFSIVFLMIVTTAVDSFACACCAERGTYIVETSTPSSYVRGLFKDMRFDTTASLYLTAGEFEAMKGLADIEKEYDAGTMGDFNLVDSYTGNTWRLTFKSPGGKTAVLALPRPSKLTSRKIEIPDNTSTAPDITLYKEFSFSGTVGSGSGFFRRGIIKPTKYTLIFQGKGNMCDNAEDFSNWKLLIDGPRADYQFFGKMKAAS